MKINSRLCVVETNCNICHHMYYLEQIAETVFFETDNYVVSLRFSD